MGSRALLGSALLFAFFLAAAWWILGRKSAPPPGPFFTLARSIPDTLTVISGLDTTVVVPGGEAGWQVIRPVRYPADGVIVEAMVKRLVRLEVDRRFPLTPEKMDTYGMRIPRGAIRAAYRDGSPPDTLTIGAFTFDDAYDYVRTGTRPEVGLLPARMSRGYFLKGTVEVRENRLLPFPETRATQILLLGQGGEVRAEAVRDTGGVWRVLRPYPGPGWNRKIGEYLESVSHMHVRSFVREEAGPLVSYGLDPAPLGIRVRLDDGAMFGASLGDPIPGTDLVYAVTLARPNVYGVSDKYPGVLRWDPDRFRLPFLVGFGLARVTRVELEADAARVVFDLSRSDSVSREAKDVLGNWVLLEATRFEEATKGALRERGLTSSTRCLRWWSGAELLARMDLGKAQAGETPLRISEGTEARPTEILFLPEDTAEPLFRFIMTRGLSP